MKRRWWVFALVALLGTGCATSTPVDCPERATLTEDGLDCEATPGTFGADGGMGGMGGGGTGGAGPVTCDDLDCDDGNECTEDSCEDAACVHATVDDGTLCTIEGVAGVCKAGACLDCRVEDCRPVYPCTEQGIRDAIEDGGDVIIGCETPTTVTLTEGVLEIANEVSLDGLGNLTLDADQKSRVFDVLEPAVVELVGMSMTGGVSPPVEDRGAISIRAGADLTLRDCRIFGNVANEHAGGLGNSGKVTIIDSEITDNLAGGRGGGLSNNEDMTIVNTLIARNHANDDGGGLYNTSNGVVVMEGSTVSENVADDHGGGIWTSGTSVQITDSQIIDNRADEGGGGFRLWNADELIVIGSVIARNVTGSQYGGGIKSFASVVSLQRTLVTQNATNEGRGGAVYNDEGSVLEVIDSVLSENVAEHGGGVYAVRATSRFIRSAVVSNEAVGFGGGFRIFGRGPSEYDLVLENCTVSDNEAGEIGGGITSRRSPLLRIIHTTIASNSAPIGAGIQQDYETMTELGYSVIHDGCVNSADAPFNSFGHNAVLDLGEDTCALSASESDLVLDTAQMGLGAVSDNGGPTPTRLPAGESLLVDAIPPEACHVDVTDDQRGQIRGNGSPCDIGAVERQVDD